MKIAVIGTKGLPPKQGGIEHYCAEVYPRMVAQGHSIDLFAHSSYLQSPWFNYSNFQGVRVISLPTGKFKGVDAFLASALGAMNSIGKQYDIVHFHALGPSLFTFLPKLASKAKIVVTCQGLDWQRAKWKGVSSGIIRSGEKQAVRFADEMIVVSQALKSYFLETYNRQTVYIPNAPASYGQSDPNFTHGNSLGLTQGRYMLFLGRLVPEKRPDLLIEAFSRLKNSGWKLVLAGGLSNTKGYVSELLNKVANNSQIIFAGELRGARLWEIVRGAGLFVLPSDVEGLPLAMLEAMQEAIPVVASDIAPHQQLIGEDRGILFQAGNIESCMNALNRGMENPDEIAAMAKNAQKNVQINYSWEHITSENLKLYNKLFNSSTPHVNTQKSLISNASE